MTVFGWTEPDIEHTIAIYDFHLSLRQRSCQAGIRMRAAEERMTERIFLHDRAHFLVSFCITERIFLPLSL